MRTVWACQCSDYIAGGVVLWSGEELVRRGFQLIVNRRNDDVATSSGQPRRLRRFEDVISARRRDRAELVYFTRKARGKLLA